MKFAVVALVALFISSPVLASEPDYTLENLKAASRQAFMMANSVRVFSIASGDEACIGVSLDAMTRAADAALFAIKAGDASDAKAARQFVEQGMFNAKKSVKLSAVCLQAKYKLLVPAVIPYRLPDREAF